MTFLTVSLDRHGSLLQPGGRVVPRAKAPDFLATHLTLDADVSDIFVFVHGWLVPTKRAQHAALRFRQMVMAAHRDDPGRYPHLTRFKPAFVGVRWPSLGPYRKMRERAHAMSRDGSAGNVLASMLGYIDAIREKPGRSGPVLTTSRGQYLHCVGHSFGGRFLGEAIIQAGWPDTAPRLGWRWTSAYPFNVDTYLGLQVAAPSVVFSDRFAPLLNGSAPIRGPVALTHSRHDMANLLWHRVMERRPAVGAVGSTWPAAAHRTRLKPVTEAYRQRDFPTRLTNVDATWLYDSRTFPVGAHSDFWHPETMHLLLSLADLAR
ncbi:hypothetical protein [Actinoplanes utahensis]|uniref:Alpha/beta hydrolase n=1 Tax=Actinoplanes utahensis TaxID=1869 RepID=A0A0A6XDM6_ACTUT|nr:hypothetical protein [Actinoplanes utahensis]KHD78192.1 hypothetical protein MB27_07045 [Actinoplanes utahensis]GIF30708.1 hypothetical protein Aut01nite_36940 [Actinoplanes utahensis]